MSTINIQTLTPVHVGSGVMLQHNTDFVVDKDQGDLILYVVDERKILQLIGEENIQHWITTIEAKKDTKEMIRNLGRNAEPSQYARREILSFCEIRNGETLKEQIHNGFGLPYIPGSSIKGAIRTAVMASLATNVNNKEDKIKDFKGRVNATTIEKEMFGNDPNNDIFRFLHVGDAYFKKGSTIATKMVNLNIRQGNNLIDTSKPQIIEAIGNESETELQLKIAKEYYDWAKSKNNSLGKMPTEMRQIGDLFNLINQHTQQLVESEISYWKEVEKMGADYYIEEMETILEHVNECTVGKSCVLRIGHGSGWRFITGAWSESLANFDNTIIPASRPNARKYEEYDFPKTRRMDEKCGLLGFVKIHIMTEEEKQKKIKEQEIIVEQLKKDKIIAENKRIEQEQQKQKYDATIEKAERLFDNGQLEEALVCCDDAAKILPENDRHINVYELINEKIKQKNKAEEEKIRQEAEVKKAAERKEKKINDGLSFLDEKFEDGRYKVTDFKGAKKRIDSWMKKIAGVNTLSQLDTERLFVFLQRVCSSVVGGNERQEWKESEKGIWKDVQRWLNNEEEFKRIFEKITENSPQ